MKAHQYMQDPTRWWHWVMVIVVALAPMVVTMVLAALAL